MSSVSSGCSILPFIMIALAKLVLATDSNSQLVRRTSSSYQYSSQYQSYNSKGYANKSNRQYYSSNYYSGLRDFSVCDGSVIRVQELHILCDSPYTFYYGNGANRNSPVCDYGDKVSFDIKFRVTDDIQADGPIYATIALYDDQGNFLSSTDPVDLCNDYVGEDCTSAGNYKFSSRMRLSYPSSENSSNEKFLPVMHMAFSTEADSGYNLGAMNIECEQWDEVADGTTWLSLRPQKPWIEEFAQDYGLLLLICVMQIVLGIFLWKQAGRQRLASNHTISHMQSSILCLD